MDNHKTCCIVNETAVDMMSFWNCRNNPLESVQLPNNKKYYNLSRSSTSGKLKVILKLSGDPVFNVHLCIWALGVMLQSDCYILSKTPYMLY